jgi:hypothetical protein
VRRIASPVKVEVFPNLDLTVPSTKEREQDHAATENRAEQVDAEHEPSSAYPVFPHGWQPVCLINESTRACQTWDAGVPVSDDAGWNAAFGQPPLAHWPAASNITRSLHGE